MAAGTEHPTLPRIFKITPTQAHDWALCGGHFAARHLSRIPRTQSYACLLGTAVHELIAAYDRPSTDGTPDIDSAIARHWRPGRFTQADEAQAREEARPLLAAYATMRGAEQVLVLESECFAQTMRRSIGDGRYIVLSGRIDRVASRQDGTVEVLDCKTGTTLPTEEELRLDPATTIYHLLAEERYGETPIVIAQLSLRTGARCEVVLGSNDIRAGKDRLREMVGQLATGDIPLTPGAWCAYCPACDSCPALGRPHIGGEDLF